MRSLFCATHSRRRSRSLFLARHAGATVALASAVAAVACSSSSFDDSGISAAGSSGQHVAGGTGGLGGISANGGTAGAHSSAGGSLNSAGASSGFAGNAGSTLGGAGSNAASGGSGGGIGGASAGGAGDGNRGGLGGTGPASSGGSGGASTGGTSGSGVLGATPPMGWNSWNTFQCNLSESLIKQMADTIVSSGMQAAGYEYVNLDDCWMDGRDASGKLRWNTTKFPDGIPALADYIHGKGLKIGIYETPNTRTCVGLYGGVDPAVAVGSVGHETTDAQTFASWGIDYLKYDKCQGNLSGFAVMRDALRATNRPIFYSINPGDGTGCPPNTCSINLPTIANMWRIGFDIGPNWSSVTSLIDQDAKLYSFAGPGHWNDPDMMEVGNGLTDIEGRAHFSMWAMLAAPLIAGNDLRKMTAATTTTLTNTDVIAVDQDPLGAQGQLVATPGTNLQVWSKKLVGTSARAVALFNRNDSGNATIAVQWSALGLSGAANVRDLWSHTDLGSFNGSYSASVPSHGVVMLKISATN